MPTGRFTKRSLPEMSAARSELRTITDTILDLESSPSQLLDAVNVLYDLCASIAGLDPEADGGEADRETPLEQGRALAPRDAARCILDYSRTSAFLRGSHDAVEKLLERSGGQRVNLLYAGCGPFAPLALPLITRFPAEQLAITFLDAHAYSTNSVEGLIGAFGASAWCSSVRSGDAMDYRHPVSEELHMLIIETMQKALEHEPQVALTRTLASQLVAGGILIPERIRLSACLADMGAEFVFSDPNASNTGPPVLPERRRLALGTLAELTIEGLRVGIEPPEGSEKPAASVLTIPDEVAQLPDLMIRTTVEVFGGHRLDDYDSGISYPTLIHHLGRFRTGDRIEFSYEEGPSPGLRVRRASTP